LAEALSVAGREGYARFVALQCRYNLMERQDYEADAATAVAREGLSCLPHTSLAVGFLTGGYRPGDATRGDSHGRAARSYLAQPRGPRVLKTLREIAGARGSTMAAVALAWLAAQPTVAVPIAGARTPEQLADLLPAAQTRLTAEEAGLLADAPAVGSA
jgi:aryl-alcohol dehydrogenase-like predicted oxidoreductase